MRWERFLSDPVLSDFCAIEIEGARALVRRGYEPHAGLLGLRGIPGGALGAVSGGRAPHPVLELSSGERVVVRAYRRGGLIRHFNRDRYFCGHRALEELRVIEHARAAGLRVPEVFAAVEHRSGIAYTASLATRWIDGAEALVRCIHDRGTDAVAPILCDAGRQIAGMHAAGITHPDLNLNNLLVVQRGEAPAVYLLDFDRARLVATPVPAATRGRNLLRLRRSARKLRAPIGPAGWAAFREGYGPSWPLRSDFG